MIDGFRTGLRLRLLRASQRIEGQHQLLRTLLGDAEDAARSSVDLHARLQRLREGLSAHFELEEGTSFPALHGLDAASGPELARLCDDHDGFLAELTRLLDGESDAAPRVLRLGRALRAHERREEGLLARLLGADSNARD
jgi:hypothetical protein